MGQSGSTREVFSKLLKGTLTESEALEVAKADRFVDQALEALRDEEPSLATWLQTDEIVTLSLKANISAIYQALISDANRGKSIEEGLIRVNTLVFRMVAAASLGAIRQERARLGFYLDTPK